MLCMYDEVSGDGNHTNRAGSSIRRRARGATAGRAPGDRLGLLRRPLTVPDRGQAGYALGDGQDTRAGRPQPATALAAEHEPTGLHRPGAGDPMTGPE